MKEDLILAYMQDLNIIKEDTDINDKCDEAEKTNEYSDADDLAEENTTTIEEDSEIEEEDSEIEECDSDDCEGCDGSEECGEDSEIEECGEVEECGEIEEADEEESLPENEIEESDENDGWDENIIDICDELTYQFDGFAYELKNCIRGSFTDANTPEELANYLENLKHNIETVISELRNL